MLRDRLGRHIADVVTIRFNADPGKRLTVEAIDENGRTAVAGKLFDVGAWLDRYGYRYALGTNGVWVRQLDTPKRAPRPAVDADFVLAGNGCVP